MTSERWKKLSCRDQLLHIGSEFERARVWEEKGDSEEVRNALERALTLIDLSIDDPQWRERRYALWVVRGYVGEFYCGEKKGVAELYRLL
jgi:hypothetical protein